MDYSESDCLYEVNSFNKHLKENLSHYRVDKDGYCVGYIDGEEEFNNFYYSMRTLGYYFSTRQSDIFKQGGNIWYQSETTKFHRIPRINFFGIPFINEKNTYLECIHGPKYFKNSHCKRRRKTRKMECPAWMMVKCVRLYTDFKLESTDWREKRKVSHELAEALKAGKQLSIVKRFYVKATSGTVHNHDIVPDSSDSSHLTSSNNYNDDCNVCDDENHVQLNQLPVAQINQSSDDIVDNSETQLNNSFPENVCYMIEVETSLPENKFDTFVEETISLPENMQGIIEIEATNIEVEPYNCGEKSFEKGPLKIDDLENESKINEENKSECSRNSEDTTKELSSSYKNFQNNNEPSNVLKNSCMTKKVSSKNIKILQQNVREELKRLIDLSYICEDVNELNKTCMVLAKRRKKIEHMLQIT